MLSLTQMTGFYVKQRKDKSFKICYFFVDSHGTMYSLYNLAQLNYYIKSSLNENDLVSKLESSALVAKLPIQNCRISGIRLFAISDNMPFYHQKCFEIQYNKINQQKTLVQLQVFSTIEDDIEKLHDLIRNGPSKPRPQALPNQEFIRKQNFISTIQELFQAYQYEPIALDSQDIKQDTKISYVGSCVNGKPDGYGTLFFHLEGIHYKGCFKNGKKHGAGYLADSNLDQFDCEFIDDILTGI